MYASMNAWKIGTTDLEAITSLLSARQHKNSRVPSRENTS